MVLLTPHRAEAILEGEEPDGLSPGKLHQVPVDREAQRMEAGARGEAMEIGAALQLRRRTADQC